ncbi:hypothetical protein BASA50_000581 [Batrachochytrium salamandrivorans]|uniref:Tail specific protease domain-containing protein n=1 Tax=Batrachochytrium salamandrivorans TaxID=1357716 RepID=A0ABQ8ETL3_9FUNG|nr:hypothetical protein BASA50_000581 [Batrachochytrium salamandrivorans]
MLVSSVITLLAISATSVLATNYDTYNLLKDDRAAGRFVFPLTTLAQKEVILSNVESALAIWVNYKSKIDHYGSAADPFPIVKKLRENIKTITDKQLQLGLTDAFAMIRDHHTCWTNMAPYSCFYATTGDYSKIQVGDELLAINGLSFVKWFDQNKFKYGFGANEFGGQRAALDYLTTIYGETNRLPSKDSINFQFKSRANPQNSHTVNIPYVSGHDEDCWNLGNKLYKSVTSRTIPGTPETSLFVSAKQPGHNHKSKIPLLSPRGHKMDSPEDPKRGAAIEKRSSPEHKPVVPMNPTDVTEVTWGIYKPDSANMGIIKLDSFDPKDVETKSLAILKAIMIIRSLLANELKDTKSVMYELRGNSGGDVRFANSMVQLFKSDFEPFGDRYLMNKITFDLFVRGKDPNVDPYAKAWQETEENSRFTNVFFTNSVESANTLGQAYLRPMGVLNDGRCYSSCELFSGAIQGHGAGTIFGEDGRTGGGGATVLKLDPFLIRASPTYFKKLPFSQELTSGSITYANTLSVGVTQFVRTGRYKGQGIEDVGIETDTVFRPRWSDLQPDSSTNTQYARIAASLARTGQKNGQSRLHFVCEPFEIENPIGKFPLEVEAAGIYEFTVFQADGKTVIAKQRSRATTKQKFSIPVSAAGSALGNNRITIVGKTAGKQVLKTIRNVRTIPDDDKYMKISTTGFTFTDLSDSVGLYQSSTTAPADGWNNLNGLWMIGNGVQYAKNIESSIEAFFIAPVGTQINIGINVALDTVPYFDFLYLSVKSSGGVEDFLLSSKSLDGKKMFNGVSGANMIVKKTIPFTTTSEKFSVALKFASDQFFQFTGVTINSFTVSAA